MSERAPIQRRALLIIAVSLGAFVAAGVALERLDYFDAARDTLQGQAGPGGLPNEGVGGEAVARAIERYGPGSAFGRIPEALPSTLLVPADLRGGPFPVLSIAADDDHLNDPDTGIMQNMRATGPDWERLASVSLWEDGELVVGSRAGLRIHGDSTRYAGDPSFRLLFRPSYGATSVSGGRLLGPDAAPAAAVVVHVVRWRGHYPNIFTFEIARRLGLPSADFRPAVVFLNGESRGIYVLTERVMPDGWGRTYFGDDNFFMYVYKGETKSPSQAAHAELEEWVRENSPLTMATAAERIDVENLTRHLLTVMFTFTTDWAQGAALLDRNDPAARWFWLHWDMDQSFYKRGPLDIEPWEQPFLELITLRASRADLGAYGILTDEVHANRHRQDMRRHIFIQLLRDNEYRRYFVRTVTDVLNHQLTPAYLQDLLDRYSDLEESPGVYTRVDLGAYFRHRPDFIRAEMTRHFSLGSPFAVRIGTSPGAALVVDGYPARGPYEGRYFPGQRLTAELAGGSPAVAWMVNGRRIEGARLQLDIGAPTTIEPVVTGGEEAP